MAKLTKKERKEKTFEKAYNLFKNNQQFLLVDMNNVTATQLQNMKMQWKEETDILLGKNTVIKKALEKLNKEKPCYAEIIDMLKTNVAFVFTKADLKKTNDLMKENSRETYAAIGMISQKEVWVRKCVTGMGPEKTKYFQALDIFTKITKGKVEITNDVLVLNKGDKVGPSQANLLCLLDIKPFIFYMKIVKVIEDGFTYEPWIIDIDQDKIMSSYSDVVQDLTALGLGCGVSSKLTVPYEFINSYKDIMCLSMATGFAIKGECA